MKPRTLARYTLNWIEDGSFIFDNESRKIEAIKQLKRIINGKSVDLHDQDDPIVEIHIGIYVPNFDYPIIPSNTWGSPVIWTENHKYLIPTKTHILKGIGISGESYYMNEIDNFNVYKNAIVKVDRYTDMKRAACVFASTLSQTIDKKELGLLESEYEVLKAEYKKHSNVKEFETSQKKLYIKWLSMFIETYGRSPKSHMKVLKVEK